MTNNLDIRISTSSVRIKLQMNTYSFIWVYSICVPVADLAASLIEFVLHLFIHVGRSISVEYTRRVTAEV